MKSLSARRAWIEMVAACPFSCCGAVALRKESVDRNVTFGDGTHGTALSLSARRAWIEIGVMTFGPGEVFGRSPQGERG